MVKVGWFARLWSSLRWFFDPREEGLRRHARGWHAVNEDPLCGACEAARRDRAMRAMVAAHALGVGDAARAELTAEHVDWLMGGWRGLPR
jgi:hypothetical protein